MTGYGGQELAALSFKVQASKDEGGRGDGDVDVDGDCVCLVVGVDMVRSNPQLYDMLTSIVFVGEGQG